MKKDRRWICFRHPTTHSHVRNARMVEQRRRRHESGFAAGENAGIGFKEYYRLETRRLDPVLKTGQWRQPVLRLCEYWSCEPEDLFPEAVERLALSQPGTGELGMSAYSARAADPRAIEDFVLLERANAAMRAMRPQDREALLLYTIEEWNCGELAAAYNISNTAVAERVKTALADLVRRATGRRQRVGIEKTLGSEWYARR